MYFCIAMENLLKLLKSYLSINAGTIIISKLYFLKQNTFVGIKYFILQTIKNALPFVIPSLESLVYGEASISM